MKHIIAGAALLACSFSSVALAGENCLINLLGPGLKYTNVAVDAEGNKEVLDTSVENAAACKQHGMAMSLKYLGTKQPMGLITKFFMKFEVKEVVYMFDDGSDTSCGSIIRKKGVKGVPTSATDLDHESTSCN